MTVHRAWRDVQEKRKQSRRYGGTEILRGERTASYKAYIQNCFKLCPRQVLHARTLGFVHPKTGRQMDFSSEWPDDMAALIDKWRKYIKKSL